MKQVPESSTKDSSVTQSTIKGIPPRFKNQNLFHGYCYCCSNFGHKAANCAFNFRNIQSKNSQLLQHRTRKSASKQEQHRTQFTTKRITHDRNNNSFDLLYNEPECCVCHNFGHKAQSFLFKSKKASSILTVDVPNT